MFSFVRNQETNFHLKAKSVILKFDYVFASFLNKPQLMITLSLDYTYSLWNLTILQLKSWKADSLTSSQHVNYNRYSSILKKTFPSMLIQFSSFPACNCNQIKLWNIKNNCYSNLNSLYHIQEMQDIVELVKQYTCYLIFRFFLTSRLAT